MNIFPFIQKFKTTLPLISALMCLTTLTAFSQKPELVVQTGHSGVIRAVVFSPDGKLLASLADDGIVIWDVSSAKQFRTRAGSHNSIAFSFDNRTIAAGIGNNIVFWDVYTGKDIRTLPGHVSEKGLIGSLSFSPDGKLLASGGGELKLWDVLTGRELYNLIGHSAVFSPDGQILAGDSGGELRFWDVSSGKQRDLTGYPRLRSIDSLAFSSDGKTLFGLQRLGMGQGKEISPKMLNDLPYYFDFTEVVAWDVASKRELYTIPGDGLVASLAIHANRQLLAVQAVDGTLRVYGALKGNLIRQSQTKNDTDAEKYVPLNALAFSPDGTTLAVGMYAESQIRLVDVNSGELLKTMKGHAEATSWVGFSPDGKSLMTTNRGIESRLWGLSTGRDPFSFRGVPPAQFTDDGKFLVSRRPKLVDKHSKTDPNKESLELRDAATAKLVRQLSGFALNSEGKEMYVGGVDISPDGRNLAVHYYMPGNYTKLDQSNLIKIVDIASGNEVRRFMVPARSFIPDQNLFDSSGEITLRPLYDGADGETTVRWMVWNLQEGKEVYGFSLPLGAGLFVALSPDGKRVYLKDDQRGIRLIEIKTGKELESIRGRFYDAVMSPNGKLLAVTTDLGLKILNAATGTELVTLTQSIAFQSRLTFSPDSKTLAVSDVEPGIKLWDVASGEELLNLIPLDENEWVVVAPDGRFDGSVNGMNHISYLQSDKLLPLDSLFDQFFTPNLLQKVFARETLPPLASKVDFSRKIRLPPVVRIVSPTQGNSSGSDTAQIVIEADDQGGGVEDIRLYQNGKLLNEVTRQLARETKANSRVFEVSLLPGVNTFRATAFNNDRTEAMPDEIKIELKGAAASANLYILAVGLNEYKNTKYNLNYGRADAQAFADAVEQRGKRIFKEIKKKVIFDADASHGGIRAAFDEIIKEARPQDVFVFFYAGHGAMSEPDVKKPSDFYLVPYEVIRIFGDGGDLAGKGIDARDLSEMLRKVLAQKQLIVIDACQSGGGVETIAMRGPAEEKAIMQLSRSVGVAVLASAGQNQFASEFDKLGHGVFTYALLKGLNGAADGAPADGKVTVKELEAYINDQVPELTKLHRGKPQYPNSATRGQDFPIGIK